MKLPDKLDKICRFLKKLGYIGSYYQLAKVLGVSHRSVRRWTEDSNIPNNRNAEVIDIFHRVVSEAAGGNELARSTVDALMNRDNWGLLSYGAKGFLIAAGIIGRMRQDD
ncbi:MAG: hypothetical protein NUW37_08560 [Planctomycetes bacterium]|nr:hypothetical protein [Planctomycetota bacterium]